MSSKLIICTTGTSVARGVGRIDQLEKVKYKKAVIQRVKDEEKKSKNVSDFLKSVSAETNSLSALGVDSNDRIVLIHTETDDGIICAENISEIIQKHFSVSSELISIDGLQVNDAQKFRREGVQNLFRKLDSLVKGCNPENVLLNGTGGFKGVVPYMTLYGLLNRINTVYLFEFSNELIKLPPFPLSYDFDRLNKAYKPLELIDAESSIKRDKFFDLISDLDHSERPWYESLIEDVGSGEVTMSPFALILWEQMKLREGQLYISEKALKCYDNSSGQVREQFNFMLSRVPNPMWRNSKIHPLKNSDMECYKPGTGERLLAVTKGSSVYICELLQHDEYIKNMKSFQRSNYNLKDFQTFSIASDEIVPESEETLGQKVLAERDEALKTVEKLRSKYKKSENLTVDLKNELVELNKNKTKLELEIENRKTELNRAASKLEDIQSKLKILQEDNAILKKHDISRMSFIEVLKKKFFGVSKN